MFSIDVPPLNAGSGICFLLFGNMVTEIEAAVMMTARNKLQKQLDTLKKKRVELAAFDDLLLQYADRSISLDINDGDKVNEDKFGNLLAEVKTIAGSSEG